VEDPSSPFRALATPPPLLLHPDRTALLVVDMQYFDAHPDWGEGRTAQEMGVAHCFDPFFSEIDAAIPHIQRLLALFRHKQMEVIHVRVAERTQNSRDVGLKQLVRGLIVPSNTREADFLESIAPAGDELIIDKSSSGVFPVTNLDRLLRNIGIDTMLFTGTSTGGCVESAVHDALDLGYQVVVVDDACADSSREAHAVALARLGSAGAHILRTDELAQALDALPDGSHATRSGIERVQAFLPTPPTTPPGPDVNPYALIFPPAVELPLAADNTALILLDAQRLVCDPLSTLGRAAASRAADNTDIDPQALAAYYRRVTMALANMQRLLATFRERNLPILHIRTAGQRSDGRDLARPLRTMGLALPLSSPDVAWMPGLEPADNEIVLNKPGSGAFTGTGLDDLLRNLGIEHLVMAGISWRGALESTIRSATDRSYGLLLAWDSCATYHPALQARLSEHESGIIRAQTTAAVVTRIATLPAHDQQGIRLPS